MKASKEKSLLEAAGKTGLCRVSSEVQQSCVAAVVWWRERREAGLENALKPGANGNGNERLGLRKSWGFRCS